jgi:hypothetical protein
MPVKRNEVLLSVAMFCLVVAIMLKRLGGSIPHVAFIEGLLLGVSVTLNITYLVRRRRDRGGEGLEERKPKRGGS